MPHNNFAARVLAWYDLHGRKHLPWQQKINPYRVWVSEIMLQQTQVSTVIPYFERFMQDFPNIHALANAEIDHVLHLWTGLGYYARGRNLHKCAHTVVHQYAGEFPRDVELLSQLPGIGRSTAAAIASISMNIPAAILDGNVKRVLTRYYAIEGWPGTGKIEKQLWLLAEQLTPNHRNADYTQAMMDLGATLCTRSKPQCEICPINKECLGLKTGNPTQFPNSKPKSIKPIKQTTLVFIINKNREILLQQQPNKGIWGGLWCPPQTENDAQDVLQTLLPNSKANIRSLAKFRHTFSHYHLDIHPVIATLSAEVSAIADSDNINQCWYNLNNPPALGLPAPIKKLIKELS